MRSFVHIIVNTKTTINHNHIHTLTHDDDHDRVDHMLINITNTSDTASNPTFIINTTSTPNISIKQNNAHHLIRINTHNPTMLVHTTYSH